VLLHKGLSHMISTRNSYVLLLLTVCQLGWSQNETSDIDNVLQKAQTYHYMNRDSAYHYYEKTIELADQQNNLDYLVGSLSSLINVNEHFYDLGPYGQNLLRMDKFLCLDGRVNDFHMGSYYKDRLLYDKGNYHYKLKEYALAKKYFLELYHKIKAVPENELGRLNINFMYGIDSFLGLIHRHTGKYEQAEFYFNRDIAWVTTYKDSLPQWESKLFNTKKLLSQVYEIQNKTTSANELLREALDFYRSKMGNPRFRNNFLTTYILLAKNQILQNDYDGAIAVLSNNEFDDPRTNPFSKEIDIIYGNAFLGKKNYIEAQRYYNKALKTYKEYRQNKPHQDIAEVHGKIAELYLKQKNHQEGLKTIQNAFNNAGNNINVTTDHGNPDSEQVYSKTQLLYLLDIKLQLLSGLYRSTYEENYLEVALQTERDLLQTFDLLKKDFDSKLDKQFLAEKAYPMFERMLDVVYMAYEKNSSDELLELALNISEKSKDLILMEALRSAQATQYGNVPQKVLDKEAQLRAEITHIEKEIFDATETESSFSDDLFDLKQEYYSFLDTIKTNYPKYYDLKYENKPMDLAKVRKKVLNDDAVLVSYSMTDKHLYAIVLNANHQNFLRLPFSEDDRVAIRDFYQLLSKPAISGVKEKISALGEQLFKKILKEPLVGFTNENLTIIPDGELHYLPFDLLRERGSYLLATKSIGYGNSVASLMELNENKSTDTNKVLAFAPSFEDAVVVNNDRQFGKLRYNDDEVAKIGAFYKTETVLNKQATLANFKAKTSDFNIVHLATHASANDAYPDYSYLAFTQEKDSSESNILYIKDLYNTSLNADLVTLSACQTGIGKLQKGQGMLSLSKGFYYAGAKSLVNTLWKINDKSSVKLMEYFYHGLSTGKSKAKALRDAKLKYLETTDDNLLKHPYYWSAFVVSGNVSPISKTNYWWYVGAAVLFFVVLFLLSKVRGKRNRFRRVTFKTSVL